MYPSALNRIMPWVWLAMGLLAIITLAQTLEKFLEKIGLVNWVEHHGPLLAYIFGGLAGLAWLLVILGALRQRDRLPVFLTERRWLMDILGRCKTNQMTCLAALNPAMHPAGESQAVLETFDGHLDLYEAEIQVRPKLIRVRKLGGRKFIDNELRVDKENF